MTLGRPPEYNEDIVNKAKEYFANLPQDEVIHSKEGLALYLGISRDTIYDWCRQEDKEDFSYIVEQIFAKQGKTLVNKGLSGGFIPSVVKVMLSKHQYREGIDHTTNDKDLPTPLLHALRHNDSDKETSEAQEEN
jgi:hypothetical protein